MPMLLKKGEMVIHHSYTVHGSYGNKSDAARRATVINVFRDGVVSDADEPLLDGVPIIPKGSKMEVRVEMGTYIGRASSFRCCLITKFDHWLGIVL